jgi:hypothetical protein
MHPSKVISDRIIARFLFPQHKVYTEFVNVFHNINFNSEKTNLLDGLSLKKGSIETIYPIINSIASFLQARKTHIIPWQLMKLIQK